MSNIEIPHFGIVELRNFAGSEGRRKEAANWSLIFTPPEDTSTSDITNTILAGMIVNNKTVTEIRDLSDENVTVLIDAAVDILNIRQEFDSIEDPLSIRDKFYYAYKRTIEGVLENLRLQAIKTVENFQPSFEKLRQQSQEIFNNVGLQAETLAPLFRQAKLWLTHSTALLILFELKEVMQTKEVTPERLEDLYFDYFERDNHDNLKKLVSAWGDNPYFVSRMSIITDALDAHIDGKYTLSVPALLPQVEGITSSILGQSASRRTGSQVRGVLATGVPQYLRTASIDTLLAFITDIAYAGTDFNNFDADLTSKALTVSEFLNRHSILHGVQIDYAHKGLSLRAFLLLDALNSIPTT